MTAVLWVARRLFVQAGELPQKNLNKQNPERNAPKVMP
jgi:hypothetical protein